MGKAYIGGYEVSLDRELLIIFSKTTQNLIDSHRPLKQVLFSAQ